MTKPSLRSRYRIWRRNMQEAPPQRWPGAIATLGVLLLLIGAALLVTYVLRLP